MFPVDYAIVGGGITGLYCALKISQKSSDKTILIIESDSELGGRIRTNYAKGFQVWLLLWSYVVCRKKLNQLYI